MRTFLTIVLVSMFVVTTHAQQADSLIKKETAFRFLLQAGGVWDENQTGFSISTVPAVFITKKLLVGVGVGMDSYDAMKVMPFFSNINYDLGNKKNRLRVSLQAGISKPFVSEKTFTESYGYKSSSWGRLISPQVGYVVQYDKVGIGFFAGMRYQRVTHHYEYPVYYYDVWGSTSIPGTGNLTDIRVDKRSGFLSVVIIW